MKKIETRGGARKGAGRKRLGKVTISANVDPKTAQKIRQQAKWEEITIGEVIDKYIYL